MLRAGTGVLSGSEPQGEEGFRELRALGVRTVVSVDGAPPNLEIARAHGMRYIHIPIGYDGISERAAAALGRVARETQGLIYVHCHHGIHRGPAAAAVVCRAQGVFDQADALKFLAVAGTGKNYSGLWRDVANYDPSSLDDANVALEEMAAVDSLASLMAQLDRRFDVIKTMVNSNGRVSSAASIAPAQEALMLREALRESQRHVVEGKEDHLGALLAAAEEIASQLERALETESWNEATRHLQTLEATCKSCHEQYRDQ